MTLLPGSDLQLGRLGKRKKEGGEQGALMAGAGEGFDDSELIYSLIRVMYCIVQYCMVSYGFYGIAWFLWYCMGVNAIQKREKRGRL